MLKPPELHALCTSKINFFIMPSVQEVLNHEETTQVQEKHLATFGKANLLFRIVSAIPGAEGEKFHVCHGSDEEYTRVGLVVVYTPISRLTVLRFSATSSLSVDSFRCPKKVRECQSVEGTLGSVLCPLGVLLCLPLRCHLHCSRLYSARPPTYPRAVGPMDKGMRRRDAGPSAN